MLTFYPDSIGFYQEIPVAPNRTIQRYGDYMLPGACRNLKAANDLNGRINRDTGEEDIQLTIWSCEAAASRGHDGIILSDLEYGVKAYHDQLRNVLPVMNHKQEPEQGTLRELNNQFWFSGKIETCRTNPDEFRPSGSGLIV